MAHKNTTWYTHRDIGRCSGRHPHGLGDRHGRQGYLDICRGNILCQYSARHSLDYSSHRNGTKESFVTLRRQ